ncbi:hypothetical protein C8R44DRAFT_741046 [Mycena epipterygia]|nr:hypothetical protein C8R44DRAFT_741046 [Mycena epipterygia]
MKRKMKRKEGRSAGVTKIEGRRGVGGEGTEWENWGEPDGGRRGSNYAGTRAGCGKGEWRAGSVSLPETGGASAERARGDKARAFVGSGAQSSRREIQRRVERNNSRREVDLAEVDREGQSGKREISQGGRARAPSSSALGSRLSQEQAGDAGKTRCAGGREGRMRKGECADGERRSAGITREDEERGEAERQRSANERRGGVYGEVQKAGSGQNIGLAEEARDPGRKARRVGRDGGKDKVRRRRCIEEGSEGGAEKDGGRRWGKEECPQTRGTRVEDERGGGGGLASSGVQGRREMEKGKQGHGCMQKGEERYERGVGWYEEWVAERGRKVSSKRQAQAMEEKHSEHARDRWRRGGLLGVASIWELTPGIVAGRLFPEAKQRELPTSQDRSGFPRESDCQAWRHRRIFTSLFLIYIPLSHLPFIKFGEYGAQQGCRALRLLFLQKSAEISQPQHLRWYSIEPEFRTVQTQLKSMVSFGSASRERG